MTSMEWKFVPQERQLFGRSIGEALAQLVRQRWPRDTAKQVAKAWDLDPTTASNVCRGHASERTISKAIKAEGWAVLEPLGRALIGQSYDQHLQLIIEETDRARQAIASRRDRVRDLEARAASLVGMGDGMAAE